MLLDRAGLKERFLEVFGNLLEILGLRPLMAFHEDVILFEATDLLQEVLVRFFHLEEDLLLEKLDYFKGVPHEGGIFLGLVGGCRLDMKPRVKGVADDYPLEVLRSRATLCVADII